MTRKSTQPPLILIDGSTGPQHVDTRPWFEEVRRSFPESPMFRMNDSSPQGIGSSLTVLNERNIVAALKRIGLDHQGREIFRIHPHGRILPSDFLEGFYRRHMDQESEYSYMDLDEIAFYHTFMEAFPVNLVYELAQQMVPSIPPDHILNVFPLGRARSLNLNREDAGIFLRGGFETMFPRPVNLNVEISSRCNARCKMCHFDRSNGIGLVDDPPPFMPMDLYRKIVTEVAEWMPKPTVDFCWRGEPLTNPQVLDYLALGREHGLPLLMTTNGSLLTPELAGRLLDLEISQLVFSIDGIRPHTYESIRRGLRYDQVKRNVDAFLEARARRVTARKTLVTVKACLQEENEEEMEDLVRYWVPRVDSVVVQNKGIYDKATREAHSYGVRSNGNGTRSVCPQPFLLQSITATGRVYDCLLAYDANDPHMGDCRETTLQELWKGETVRRKREAMLKGDYDQLPVCSGCHISSSMATVKKEVVGGALVQKKSFCTIYSRV